MQELINRAKELLADGTVARVLGWKAGDLPYNPEPAYFETEESLKDFVYNGFCGANLSKYMIEASKLEGKTMVCLKPCDIDFFFKGIKCQRTGCIAGDHNCFYALFLQESDDLSGVPDNGFFGFASIRNAGGISEVYDFFHGQVSHDFSGHREPADTGIKYTYRCVTICFHVSSPIQVSCFYSYIFLLSLLTYLSYSTCFVRRIQV